MLRSMYSGISGLRNFQTKLDVIGNNIANVNTYGFKKGRVIFKDLISQTVADASGASASRGGINPKQVGLGSQISAIDTLHNGGSTQFTGNTLDLAISGEGFFQVQDGNQADPNEFSGTIQYTRAGNFYMDNKGFLVNSEGKYLVGIGVRPAAGGKYPEAPVQIQSYTDGARPATTPTGTAFQPIQIPTDAQSMSISQDGVVTFVDADGILSWAGQLEMVKFSNPGGLNKVGGNYFEATANSGVPYLGTGTTNGIGEIQSGFLEMSNVDLAEEFTEMIVAQRGFQANTRIITTSDEILQELVNLKR